VRPVTDDLDIPGAKPASDADRDLLARLLAGDEAAFVGLVRKHQRGMRSLALCFVSSPSVADEVVQECWEAILRGLPKFQGRSRLSTWIFRIVANRARTRGTREARSRPFSAFETDEGPAIDPSAFLPDGHWRHAPGDWGADPEKRATDRELAGKVLAMIEDLPPGPRAVVWMRDVEGLDPDDVCNVLAIQETNQRVLLHRGRTRLREALDALMRTR
jgi:RNA polymerase sigma-70 factor (ECF subfamily)